MLLLPGSNAAETRSVKHVRQELPKLRARPDRGLQQRVSDVGRCCRGRRSTSVSIAAARAFALFAQVPRHKCPRTPEPTRQRAKLLRWEALAHRVAFVAPSCSEQNRRSFVARMEVMQLISLLFLLPRPTIGWRFSNGHGTSSMIKAIQFSIQSQTNQCSLASPRNRGDTIHCFV